MKINYIPYIRKKIHHELVMAIGVGVLIYDENDRILLEKRRDNSLYCLPGGGLNLGEKVIDGAKREVLEETGLKLEGDLDLFMVQSGEDKRINYPNGDITEYVSFIFIKKVDSKKLKFEKHDDESISIRFYSLSELPPKDEFLKGEYQVVEKFIKKDFKVKVD